MAQCLWTGGYENNARLRLVAEDNLRFAREAGIITIGYVVAGPYWPVALSITEAESNAGEEWEPRLPIAVDVEIAGTQEQHIRDLCDALRREMDTVCIYSARWFWIGHLGNPQWPWLLDYKISEAFYDDDRDIDFASAPWGPWTVDDIVWEQFTNTQDSEGVQVCWDIFDLDFFKEGENMSELDELRRENEEIKIRQDKLDGDREWLQDAIHELVEKQKAVWDWLKVKMES